MAGRPTYYRSEFAEQAEKLCKLGATDAELGDFFGVDESTINRWKLAHKEFCASIKRGKVLADANVADRLYKRATGYEHPDVDIKMFEGDIIETPLVKHYPPDTTAAIFWLKNRQPRKWRDQQQYDHTTNGESLNRPDLSKYSDDELRILAELQRKGGAGEA